MNTLPTYNDDPELPFGNALKNADGFKVPDHYFKAGEEILLAQFVGLMASNVNKTKAFEVPGAYFENFPDVLMERINDDTVAFLPKSDGFKVPENYFETFSDRLHIKLNEKQQTPALKVLSFHKLWYYAAAACLFTAIGLFSLKWMQNDNSSHLLSQCSEDELIEYVTAYADEFDEQSIAMLLEETDIDPLDIINDLDEADEDLLIEYLE